MTSDKRLKLAPTFFAIVWSLGMIWWSDSAEGPNVIFLSLCGIAGGIGWYRLTRWRLPHGLCRRGGKLGVHVVRLLARRTETGTGAPTDGEDRGRARASPMQHRAFTTQG